MFATQTHCLEYIIRNHTDKNIKYLRIRIISLDKRSNPLTIAMICGLVSQCGFVTNGAIG